MSEDTESDGKPMKFVDWQREATARMERHLDLIIKIGGAAFAFGGILMACLVFYLKSEFTTVDDTKALREENTGVYSAIQKLQNDQKDSVNLLSWKVDQLVSTRASYDSTMGKLQDSIQSLNLTISKLQTQMDLATKNREAIDKNANAIESLDRRVTSLEARAGQRP